MSLVKPILNPISAFNATSGITVSFVASGGDEVTGNELKIVTNDASQTIVYDNTILSTSLTHEIPANILTNGNYYYATVRTYNSLNETSEWSANQPFYCFSEPTLEFSISEGEVITTDFINISMTYNQIEGERLSFGVIDLYRNNDVLYKSSGNLYDYSAPPNILSWQVGIENNTTYVLVGEAQTEHGMLVTRAITFSVEYSSHTGEYLYSIVDNCEGSVEVKTEGIVVTDSDITKTFNGLVDGTINDFINYDNQWLANLVSADGIEPLVENNTEYANVVFTNFLTPTNFIFGIEIIPTLIDNEIARLSNGSDYISISINRGTTQDYISVSTSNGTIIDKGIGIFCNGHYLIDIFVKMIDGILSISTNVNSSSITPILNWNNNINNNVYNMFTSNIIFMNENGGNFIPRETIINEMHTTFDTITIGNGLYKYLVLSTNLYSDSYFSINPSNIIYYDFNNKNWDNNVIGNFDKVVIERNIMNGDLINPNNWIQVYEQLLEVGVINYITFDDKYIPTGKIAYKLKIYNVDTVVYESLTYLNVKWNFVFISDIEKTFRLQSGVVYSNNQQNVQNNILMPIGATYPIVIQNANGNYRSGSVQFTVLGYEFDNTYKLDRISITQELNDILQFLTNMKPKVIKDYNGNIFICRVVNTPQISFDANWGNGIPKVSFDWVEQGKYDDITTMQELGFYN